MTRPHQTPRDEAVEHEWALQEKALRAERLGLDPSADADMQGYRAVARVLRQPLDAHLPVDFAAQVAARAHRRKVGDMRLELWLSGVLLGVLAAMLAGLALRYGDAWLRLAQASLPMHGLANPWLLALAACVAMPGILGRLLPTPGTSDRR